MRGVHVVAVAVVLFYGGASRSRLRRLLFLHFERQTSCQQMTDIQCAMRSSKGGCGPVGPLPLPFSVFGDLMSFAFASLCRDAADGGRRCIPLCRFRLVSQNVSWVVSVVFGVQPGTHKKIHTPPSPAASSSVTFSFPTLCFSFFFAFFTSFLSFPFFIFTFSFSCFSFTSFPFKSSNACHKRLFLFFLLIMLLFSFQ